MLEYDSWGEVESPDGDCWDFVGPGLPHPAGYKGTSQAWRQTHAGSDLGSTS